MRTTLDIDQGLWPEFWQAAYRLLEETEVEGLLKAWVQPLEIVEAEENEGRVKIQMAAPNEFSVDWVRAHFKKKIEAAFAQTTGKVCELILFKKEFSAQEGAALHETPTEESPEPVIEAAGVVVGAKSRAIPDWQLNPLYTFENFIVGASNQFAHAAAVAVGEQPGKQYNPLFLYSPPGLGKTHLLHAIGNHVLAKRPNARVAYLSAETFVNELIDKIQHNKMSRFRDKYRDSFDVLLIDDIQFIAKKKSSEDEFFHTFNTLHASKRQIVVTSDRLPKEIEGLEERIRTRFEWGLIADIGAPEIETRIAILKSKAEHDDIYLPDEVATFLATHIKNNVRELEGVLIRLKAQASLTGEEISLEMAKRELKIAIPEEGTLITIDSIQNAVARHFRIRIQDLKSTTRVKTVAFPRQIAMYLIRKYTGVGFQEIGHHFGGKDHTTILYACNKIEKELSENHAIRDAVEKIQNLL